MSYPTYDLTVQKLFRMNLERAKRWHGGNIHSWTPLEWAGAMCGEAGEAANAAKKLKRVVDNISNLNEGARHLPSLELAQKAIVQEVCDTILYAILLAASVGASADQFEQALCEVFNSKSEEYNFPERL